MPRNAGTVVENNFAAGFITEGTALTFPPNSWKDADNCIPEQTGNVTRRLGIDIESNHSERTVNRTGDVITTYLWENVGGSATLQLLVVQIGDTLYFYDGSTTDPLSSHPITDTIDLTDFSPAGFDGPETYECQFADGNGLLFVVNPNLDAFYVSYDENTQTFTATQIDIKIRDLAGVEDGMDVDERPTNDMGNVSNQKKYNLYNQGWETTQLNTWDAARTDLPSNADVMWTFKDANEDFDVTLVPKFFRGNSPAPKGHFILDLYSQDRTTASGVTITTVTIPTRASTVAFHAGRVFYGGIKSEGYNANIYFTQVVERDSQYGLCHQINDPTSELLFDLLPTDGGFISIRECGNIIKLAAIGQGLVVFATNGVWLVSGSTGLGFTANDYSIVKIAETSCLTSSSFVEVKGTMTWWNLDGIYTLQMEGPSGKTVSLTEPRIKSYYNTIPPSSKRRATGFYNGVTGIIQWLYREEEAGTPDELYEATHILNLNLNTGAFYIWTPSDSDVKIHSCVVLEHEGGDIVVETVVDDSAVTVVDDSGEEVIVYTLENSTVVPKFKYLVSWADSGNHKLTFAEAWDTDYEDWATRDAEDFSSYFITGYSVRGEGNKEFQSNYVTFYADNTSIFDIQGIWDFSNSGNSGKWSNTQRIDNTSKTNFDYVTKKMKFRGNGKAVQVKVSSVTGEPFDISGWSTQVSGNTLV